MKSLFTADPFGAHPSRLGQVPKVTVQDGGFGGPWGGSFFAVAPGSPTMPLEPYAFDGEEPRLEQWSVRRMGQAEISLSPDVATDYTARVNRGLRVYLDIGDMIKEHPDEAKAAGLPELHAKLDRVANLNPAQSGIDWTGILDALKSRRALTQKQMDAINALDAAAKEAEPKLEEVRAKVEPPPSGMPLLGTLLLGAIVLFGALEGFGTTNILGLRRR